jgi:hypothetical protein
LDNLCEQVFLGRVHTERKTLINTVSGKLIAKNMGETRAGKEENSIN